MWRTKTAIILQHFQNYTQLNEKPIREVFYGMD
jgi:hypothetical protein